VFELVPLALGATIGALIFRLGLAAPFAAFAGACGGVLVAVASGEVAESWGYALFDAGQGAVSAWLVYLLLQARAARRLSRTPLDR
jgi:hypothetical protein